MKKPLSSPLSGARSNPGWFSQPPLAVIRVALGFLIGASASLSAATWPLTGALGAHDPTIIKEGSRWWCFTTGSGLPVKYSDDGLAWTQGVQLFETELPWWRNYAPQMGNLDVWAPDLQKFGNRTWCYYSVSEFGKNNSAIGLKSCSSIALGDWRDDGLVISSKAGVDAFNAIDPNLTVDSAGTPWLVFGSWFDGIQIVQLDPGTMKPTGAITPIARKPNGIEGANVVSANGYYYLFVSVDICCQGVNSTYKIAYGRSLNIKGPYADKNNVPMLESGRTILEESGVRWVGPGGQDVYKSDVGWVIARHAYDATANGKPTLRISDLYWDADFWPTLVAPPVTTPNPDLPVIVTPPVSQTVAPGSPVTFSVRATGPALSFVWTKNGNALAGANSADLTLLNLIPADDGDYIVTVTNSVGVAVSRPATLLVATPDPGRLVNLSVRSSAGKGDQTLIMGFVVAGGGLRQILIRALGPKLTEFGVTNAVPDPKLLVFDSHGTVIGANDDWPVTLADTASRVGAIPLTPDSKDAGLLMSAAPGVYSAQVTGDESGTSVALAEAYDADVGPGSRLVNVSARAQVGVGNNILIAGFVLSGNVPRKLLIRGLGPALVPFGVATALTDPLLRLFNQGGVRIDENDDWSGRSDLKGAATQVGALALASDLSKDAALLVTLVPGVYSAQVSGGDGGTGVALVEIYEVL
jgi:arabinan endo-1,5-alpha-L-arabinosidase